MRKRCPIWYSRLRVWLYTTCILCMKQGEWNWISCVDRKSRACMNTWGCPTWVGSAAVAAGRACLVLIFREWMLDMRRGSQASNVRRKKFAIWIRIAKVVFFWSSAVNEELRDFLQSYLAWISGFLPTPLNFLILLFFFNKFSWTAEVKEIKVKDKEGTQGWLYVELLHVMNMVCVCGMYDCGSGLWTRSDQYHLPPTWIK